MYTAQRIDYSGGQLFGQETESPTRTLLSFMISSAAGNYSDLVCFVPVVTLNFDILMTHFKKVLEGLGKIGFLTLAVISDNHKVNAKLFTELSEGEMKPRILHPFDENRPLFLLFDPVHIMKNFFNNFQRKR